MTSSSVLLIVRFEYISSLFSFVSVINFKKENGCPNMFPYSFHLQKCTDQVELHSLVCFMQQQTIANNCKEYTECNNISKLLGTFSKERKIVNIVFTL